MIINRDQRDILSEIVNIGIGRAAAALNDMTGHHIQLQTPKVVVCNEQGLQARWLNRHSGKSSTIYMDFTGTLSGNAALMFPPESAAILVSTLTDEPPLAGEMDALCMGTLTEVGNILINGVIGSIANALHASMHFSLPNYIECEANDFISHTQLHASTILIANTTFSIDDLQVSGEMVLFFEEESFTVLLAMVNQELSI